MSLNKFFFTFEIKNIFTISVLNRYLIGAFAFFTSVCLLFRYVLCITKTVLIGLQVISSDLDSDPRNKAANYSITSGDQFRAFDVHPSEGTIFVRNHLDRETVRNNDVSMVTLV